LCEEPCRGDGIDRVVAGIHREDTPDVRNSWQRGTYLGCCSGVRELVSIGVLTMRSLATWGGEIRRFHVIDPALISLGY
jgi:hypothetical protein